MRSAQIPTQLKTPDNVKPDEFILRGGSCIIDPKGEFITEPVFDQEKLILAEIEPSIAIQEKMTLDTSGHYQRSDVFSFSVNAKREE